MADAESDTDFGDEEQFEDPDLAREEAAAGDKPRSKESANAGSRSKGKESGSVLTSTSRPRRTSTLDIVRLEDACVLGESSTASSTSTGSTNTNTSTLKARRRVSPVSFFETLRDREAAYFVGLRYVCVQDGKDEMSPGATVLLKRQVKQIENAIVDTIIASDLEVRCDARIAADSLELR